MIMRNAVLFAALLAAGSAHAQSRNPENSKPRTEATRTKSIATNPCAQLGAGFVRLEGSDTCVKVGGSVSVGAGAIR